MAAMAAASWGGAPAWRSYGGGALQKQSISASTARYDGLKTLRRLSISSTARTERRGRGQWLGHSCVMTLEGTATETEKKMAKLYVQKNQTVPLPIFMDASGNPQHLKEFLREPEGRQCMLNVKTLRKYEDVGNGVFKCYLPTMEFLSFKVAPVIDLLVDAKEDSCQVDMLSCKFEGSDIIRGQNERFSASLRNHLSWSSSQQQQHLHVRVELNVALEVYTLPFTVLPISAVESPGTMILQALVDRLIPLFVDQLFMDFQSWAESRSSGANGGELAGEAKEVDVTDRD